MDRGYVDFQILFVIHQAGAFCVTRTKVNMKYHRVYSHPVPDPATGRWLRPEYVLSMVFIPNKIILSTYGASRSAIQKQGCILCS